MNTVTKLSFFVILLGSCTIGLAAQTSPRERLSFNADWRFHRGEPADLKMSDKWKARVYHTRDGEIDYPVIKEFILATGNNLTKNNPVARPAGNPGAGVSFVQPGFDDKDWRTVTLPHDWAIEGPFEIKGDGGTGKLPWIGPAWYRKHFSLPASDAGRRIVLEIDGAMSFPAVWVNGQMAGGWAYGYSSFQIDITPFVKFGEGNTIAIHLDNPHGSSRWYPGAGLYRNVWLTKTSPIHIAQWGTYVTTPEVSAQEAVIKMKGVVQNQDASDAKIMVSTGIYELDGQDKRGDSPVATISPAACNIASGKSTTFEGVVKLASPKLWDTGNPHRYVAVTEVLKQGKVVDIYETPFGIRTINFTGDNGFLLNGKRVQIKGVCMHHDLGALGTAFNVRAAQRQWEILKEMGANAIRTSHNMPAPELLELCDKMGILVANETFDSWEKGKGRHSYGPLFKDWHERDLRAFVRRDRNHPSVITWSMGNEIKEQGSPDGARILGDLAAITRDEDPTRPVSMGINWWHTFDPAFTKQLDVMGANYPVIIYDKFRAAHPDMPFYNSESASTVSSRGVYFFPPDVKLMNKEQLDKYYKDKLEGESQKGNFQVTSYDTYRMGWGNTPDGEFSALENHIWAAGEFVWTGFDYLGEPSPYNSDLTNLLNFRNDPVKMAAMEKELKELGKINTPSRSSYFGIVDLAGFKKDRFYLYQAHWRPDFPMVHVLPHWNWPDRIGKVTPVFVYTSGDEVELFLNGKSLGRLQRKPLEYRFKWQEVVYAPGELKAIAYKNGKVWAEETVKTTGSPAGIKLEVDRPVIRKDCVDLAFVTARVVDANGLTVPVAMNPITFAIAGGPGAIVATDNGDATDLNAFSNPERKAFNGLALAIVRFKAGEGTEIKLSATSEGLSPATCAIRSQMP